MWLIEILIKIIMITAAGVYFFGIARQKVHLPLLIPEMC